MKIISIPVNPRGPQLTIDGDAERLSIAQGAPGDKARAEIVLDWSGVGTLRRAVELLDAEKKAARALGGRRIGRARGLSAPDVVPPAAWVLEAKTRRKLPAIVTAALRQAERYALRGFGQKPIAVLRETGSRRAVAVVWLDDLASRLATALNEHVAHHPAADLPVVLEAVGVVAKAVKKAWGPPHAPARA